MSVINKDDLLDAVERTIMDDEMVGFCTACGEEQGGVEPDAERYTCQSCGANTVYGAEMLLLMGYGDE
jgi:hypothetical protein